MEPTDAQIQAFKTAWEEANSKGQEGDRVRAGLKAAMFAEQPKMAIYDGWLVEEVDHHTCGAGDEHGHEPFCGLLPLVQLDELPGWPA